MIVCLKYLIFSGFAIKIVYKFLISTNIACSSYLIVYHLFILAISMENINYDTTRCVVVSVL
jgi:hypothetical protein